jgi:hypothetical protein
LGLWGGDPGVCGQGRQRDRALRRQRVYGERTVWAIAQGTAELGAFVETILAFADKIDSTTARTLVERTISAIAQTSVPEELEACAQIITALRTVLPQEAMIVAATEFLKYPFAAMFQTTSILRQAISTIVPEGADGNFWEFVVHLGKHQPWIPLSRPWQGANAVIADFCHLLNHGPPLPPAALSASDI